MLMDPQPSQYAVFWLQQEVTRLKARSSFVTCAAEVEELELVFGQGVLVELLPRVLELQVLQDHVFQVEPKCRNPGNGVDVLAAVLRNSAWRPVADLLEQVHVGVEANAEAKNWDLSYPVRLVNGLNNLPLDRLVAPSWPAIRDEDYGGERVLGKDPRRSNLVIEVNSLNNCTSHVRDVSWADLQAIYKLQDLCYDLVIALHGVGIGRHWYGSPEGDVLVEDDQVEQKVVVEQVHDDVSKIFGASEFWSGHGLPDVNGKDDVHGNDVELG